MPTENLSRLEQETIISFNAQEKTANVYSNHPGTVSKLARRLGPGKDTGLMGQEWTIPKAWITLPKRRTPRAPLSAEQKQARAARLQGQGRSVTP